MFRAIASLMLFGTLSPLGVPSQQETKIQVPFASPPSVVARFTVGEEFSASGAIVIDATSGKKLFGLAADRPRSMGSLAKLMTAIVILENHKGDEIVTVPYSVTSIEGNVARLRPGERYTVQDLLSATLIASANDAAHTLAMFHSGTSERFAEVMNERAVSLGLTKTHFRNPVGFDSRGQMSTPRELAWLSMYALKNEIISSLVQKRSATIRDSSREHSITLFNTNQLLSSHPSKFFGLKTGTTSLAGQCLISLAYAYGRPYIIIVMNSSDRYRDTLELFDSLSLAHVYI